jgi:hypothetical protein
MRAPFPTGAAWAIATGRQAVGRRSQLRRLVHATVLDLGSDAHRFEVHEMDAASGAENLAGALQVLAGSFAKSLRLDQVRNGRHRYSLPRFARQRPIASNDALKLPTPKAKTERSASHADH